MKTSIDVFGILGLLVGFLILLYRFLLCKKQILKLQEQSIQTESLFSICQDGYCKMNKEGVIQSVNEQFCRLFHCTYEELVGQDFVHWIFKTTGTHLHPMDNLTKKEYLVESSIQYVGADGEMFAFNIRFFPIGHNNLSGFYAVFRDITPIMRAERTLVYWRDTSLKLFDMVPDVISFKDSDGHWQIANSAKLRLFKLEGVDYKGKTDAQLVPEAKTSQDALIQSRISDNLAWDVGVRIRLEEVIRTENQERTFDVIKIPVHNEDGSKRGILEVGRDISERVRAQAQLKESEERYRSLMEYHSSAVFSFNMRGRITMVNAMCVNMLGYSEREMNGRSFTMFMDKDNAHKALLHVNQTLRGIPGDKTYRCVNKLGIVVELLVVLIPITINRRVVGLYAVAKDVTIQNRLQRENDWLNRQNELILNSAGEGIYGIDINGRITFCNPAAARMLGWKVHELIGKCINEIVCSLSTLCDKCCLQGDCVIRDTLLKGENFGLHYDQFFRKDGSAFQVEYVATPIVRDGGVAGGVVAFRDITEQYQMQRQFEELNRQYQLIFDSAGEGICLTDVEGKVILCNPAMLKMIGYEREELTGRMLHEFVHLHQKCGPVHEGGDCLFSRSMREGVASRETNEVFWRKDGTGFVVEYVMTPIVVDNKCHGFVLIVQDVTIRKEAEEMLLKSAKLSVVGQLAAGVAHEIRNPLTALKGFIQLLDEEYTSKKMYFSIMQSELERIEAIVNEFLILAKPHKVRFEPRDLVMCVNSVIDLLKTQAALHNIQIRATMDEKLPLVECDENRLKQVFVNLLKNAIEAMPTGGVVHIESGIANDSLNHSAFVRITDEGQGIPSELLPNLGEPFYSTKEKGTGLGLMVSHKIIESHSGTMRIDSEVGKGTTVEIHLPFSHSKDDETNMHLLERAFSSRFSGTL